MKTKITSILLLFLLAALTVKAQEETQNSSFVKIHSVNLSIGYYHPSMDYWNDTYLPTLGVIEDFKGNISIGGNLTFSLPENFKARLGISYWSDKVEGNISSDINSLKIAFTRFKLGILYFPEIFQFQSFEPYIGAEGHFYIIKDKLDDGEEIIEKQGQDYSFAPLIGIKRSFGQFETGIEFSYIFGKYTQDIIEGLDITNQKISINGPEISISVGYKLKL